MIIAPSLLSADFSDLKNEISAVESAGAQWLHLDVMDGHFVPNFTFGAPLIKKIRPHTNLFFDAHLMVTNPLDFLDSYKKAGVDQITVHIETLKNPRADLLNIKNKGFKVGLTLQPKTPVENILPFINIVDNYLVMTVEPGFGGQSFMKDQLPKIEKIAEAIKNSDREITLQVDGGVNKETIELCANAGANVFVAGSAVFSGATSDYAENITALKSLL